MLRFELPPETDAPDGGFLYRGTFSPDGRFIAVARSDRRLRVWHAATGQLVGKPLVHEEPVTGVSFDPTGKVLVTTAGKKIYFWNVERSVQEGETLSSEDDNRGVEVSGDGSHLLTWTGSPGKVIVWDFKSRKRLHLLEGIDFSVYHAGFSPDGRLVLASGSLEIRHASWPMVAQFWEVATGRPVGIRMRWQSSVDVGRRFHPALLPA